MNRADMSGSDTVSVSVSRGHSLGEARKNERMRAILRAPLRARELYLRGLLGQKEAASLGPAYPTPEKLAEVNRIARELWAEFDPRCSVCGQPLIPENEGDAKPPKRGIRATRKFSRSAAAQGLTFPEPTDRPTGLVGRAWDVHVNGDPEWHRECRARGGRK